MAELGTGVVEGHAVEVGAVGEAVAVSVGAIPGKIGDVVADVQRAKLVHKNLAHHFAREGHNLDFHVAGQLLARQGEYEAGLAHHRVGVRVHVGDLRGVHHLKFHLEVLRPGAGVAGVAALHFQRVHAIGQGPGFARLIDERGHAAVGFINAEAEAVGVYINYGRHRLAGTLQQHGEERGIGDVAEFVLVVELNVDDGHCRHQLAVEDVAAIESHIEGRGHVAVYHRESGQRQLVVGVVLFALEARVHHDFHHEGAELIRHIKLNRDGQRLARQQHRTYGHVHRFDYRLARARRTQVHARY